MSVPWLTAIWSSISVPILISLFAIFLALLTFLRGRPSEETERVQDYQMRIVAGRVLSLYEDTRLIPALKKTEEERKKRNAEKEGEPMRPAKKHVFPAMQRNAQLLEEALEKGIGLGLMTELMGSRPLSMQMFHQFRRELLTLSQLDPREVTYDTWAARHYLCGLIRLLDQLSAYREQVFPKSVQNYIKDKIAQECIEEAWEYLRQQTDCHSCFQT